jgi:hypothetical protein
MCAAPVPLGFYNDLGGTQSHSVNYLLGYAVTTSSAVTLYRFGLIARNITGTKQARMALYEAIAGVPRTLVAQTDLFTLSNGRNGDIAPLAGVALKASTTYFIMAKFDTATDIGHDSTSGTTWHIVLNPFLNPFFPELNDGSSGTTTSPQAQASNINFYILTY